MELQTNKELIHNQYSEMLRDVITEIKSARVTLAQRINSGMMAGENMRQLVAVLSCIFLSEEKMQQLAALLPEKKYIIIKNK